MKNQEIFSFHKIKSSHKTKENSLPSKDRVKNLFSILPRAIPETSLLANSDSSARI